MQHLPWFAVVLGLLLVGQGAWLLAGGRVPGLRMASRGRAVDRSLPSVVVFGVAYALASLSCTIAPFLVTVVASFRAESALGGVLVFGAYALGMGLVVGVVSLAVAWARTSPVTRLRRVGPPVSRISGGLLVMVGGYVAYSAGTNCAYSAREWWTTR